MRQRFGDNYGSEENPAPYPPAGELVSDYDTPGIQAMAFPTLFPYGTGDVTKKDRRVEVTMTDANKHLLKYAVWDVQREVWFYPFADHDRWCHWGQDTAERHRFNGQKSVYLSKSPEDANLTEEDMREIVEENGERLRSILARMSMFIANINGSPAYLHKWKIWLEALMEQEGMCSIWFSLSMADNHWDDLHRALDPKLEERDFADEKEKAKWKRKLVRENPHLVDAFFFRRVNVMFETFLGSSGFEAIWHWLRGELQARGAYHGHGCARLKHDPGFARLAQLVCKGRQAQMLAERCEIELGADERFSDSNTCDDEWAAGSDPDFEDEEAVAPPEELTLDQIEEIKSDIQQGIEAERQICCFQTLLLSTMHPNPPADARAMARDPNPDFVQGPDNLHPAAVKAREVLDDGIDDLLNAVERHRHQAYCQSKKRSNQSNQGTSGSSSNAQPAAPAAPVGPDTFTDENCRFDYGKDICELCHVVVKEYIVTKRDGSKEKHTKIEVKPKRNDRWLNSHMAHLMTVWRANMDMQLTIDLGKVVGYMTKYVTKTEASMTRGARRMVNRILQNTVDEGQSVEHALKKTMGKLLGERTQSKQEKCHLIMSAPTCSCSHSFVPINLQNDSNRLLLDRPVAAEAGDGEQQQADQRAAKMTLMDAYQCCLDSSKWLREEDFREVEGSLRTMDFRTFALRFAVGERRAHRNKIKNRPKAQTVIVFQPRLSSDPQSPSYTDYCRFALIKYKPWPGQHPSSLWGGANATDEQIQLAWTNHVRSYSQRGEMVPDFVRREIELYHSNTENEEAEPHHDLPPNGEQLQRADFFEEHVPLAGEELVDPADASIQWTKDHDWSVPEQDYDDSLDLDDAEVQWNDMLKNFAAPVEAAEDEGLVLNEMQQLGREMIVGLVNDPDSEKFGILTGKGGTGKSTSINAAVVDLEAEHGVGCVLNLATTGMAATVIGGSTAHSPKNGLGLPVGSKKFKELRGKPLQNFQKRLRKYVLLLLDEYSMLRQKELFYMHKLLQQAFGNDELFGGLPIGLIGDPGQIPCVMGWCLWDQRGKGNSEDFAGHQLYLSLFKKVIELTEVRRVVGNVDAASFITDLDRVQADDSNDNWFRVLDHTLFKKFLFKASALDEVRNALDHEDADDFLERIDSLRPEDDDDFEIDDEQWQNTILDFPVDLFLQIIAVPEARRVLDDPETARFLGILDRMRDGLNTEEDWLHVCQVCSRDTMGETEWKRRFGNEENNTFLFTTNAKVDCHNHQRLQKLGKPIALIEAEHTGKSKKMGSDSFMGLCCILFLAVSAKVVLTSNVCQPAGLCNGATGVVKDIIYDEGKTAPALPRLVWVDFGANYKGDSFFPDDESRRGWVPIHPMTAKEHTNSTTAPEGYEEHTRTMLPLRLAWAWTIWKAQGQTILGNVICFLGPTEKEHGLTYTAFSRVKALCNFGIIGGLTFERFTKKIRQNAKVVGRIAEESRLRRLAAETVAYLRGRRNASMQEDSDSD